jgi:hypothetical protein
MDQQEIDVPIVHGYQNRQELGTGVKIVELMFYV